MAQVEVENMEENADLFMAKMGFPHDAEGLEMSDDQLVNFLLLCHQDMMGVDGEDYGEDYEEVDDQMMDMPHDSDVKVKVMKLVYKTKAEAERQGRAAHASGYGKKKKGT